MSQSGEQATSVAAPMVKIATGWAAVGAAVGINSWSDVSAAASALAAVVTALYTFALLSEWMWKKAIRPFCEHRGWLARKRRRKEDFE